MLIEDYDPFPIPGRGGPPRRRRGHETLPSCIRVDLDVRMEHYELLRRIADATGVSLCRLMRDSLRRTADEWVAEHPGDKGRYITQAEAERDRRRRRRSTPSERSALW